MIPPVDRKNDIPVSNVGVHLTGNESVPHLGFSSLISRASPCWLPGE